MNIIIVCNGWPSDILGGGENHIINVSKYWSKKARVYLVAPFFAGRIIGDKKLNTILYTDILYGYSEPPILYLRYIYRILSSLRTMFKYNIKADYVISATNHLYDIIPALIYSFIKRSKLVFYVHSLIDIRLRYGILDFIRSLVAYITQMLGLFLGGLHSYRIFVINPLIKRLIHKKSYLTWNGVDPINRFEALEKVWDFCYIGRLDKTKGVETLLEAWKIANIEGLKMKLVLVGGGGLYKLINALIRSGNIRHVCLVGPLYGRRKYRVLRQSRFLVNLSESETFSTVILEALALGVPVIARNLPILKAIYGDMLIYVDDISPEGLAKYLMEKIREYESIAEKVSSSSSLLARRYSWEKIASYELKVIVGGEN